MKQLMKVMVNRFKHTQEDEPEREDGLELSQVKGTKCILKTRFVLRWLKDSFLLLTAKALRACCTQLKLLGWVWCVHVCLSVCACVSVHVSLCVCLCMCMR